MDFIQVGITGPATYLVSQVAQAQADARPCQSMSCTMPTSPLHVIAAPFHHKPYNTHADTNGEGGRAHLVAAMQPGHVGAPPHAVLHARNKLHVAGVAVNTHYHAAF